MDDRTFTIIEHLNARWQPAVTSTPLKMKTGKWENNGVKNVGLNKHENLLNSILNHYQKVNTHEKSNKTFKKNVKKSKHSFYFDESSSSADEDVSNSNNAEVKINLHSHSRMREKEIDIQFEEGINSSDKDIKLKKKSISNSKKSREKNKAEAQNKDKVSMARRKLPPVINIKENSIVLKKTRRKEKKIGPDVNEKNIKAKNSVEKVCNISVKNVKDLSKEEVSNSNNNSKVINDVCKPVEDKFSKNAEKLKEVDKNKLGEDDDIIFKTPLKPSNVTKKGSNGVSMKRRDTTALKSKIPKKKVKKKELKENMQTSIENYLKSPILDCEKKNSSHQLFSESKEQELINSLNMTAQDDSPSKQKNIATNSLLQENDKNQQNCNEICHDEDFKVLKIKEVLVQNNNVDSDSNDKNLACKTDNEKEQLIAENDLVQPEPPLKALEHQENNHNNESIPGEKNCRENQKTNTKIKKSNFKNKKLPELNENENLQEIYNNTEHKSISEKESKTPSKFSSIKDVFKMTNQLTSFIENQPGCFTEECWSLKNFKCGILKVKPKSKVGSKTAYDNSYFGGVVLKGSLKVYIGEEKIELQEGGMAFVPPLTEWMIINLRKTEAIMYYWFGRFRA